MSLDIVMSIGIVWLMGIITWEFYFQHKQKALKNATQDWKEGINKIIASLERDCINVKDQLNKVVNEQAELAVTFASVKKTLEDAKSFVGKSVIANAYIPRSQREKAL